jgi:CubicO group peptidase (beta-lactamase class C family)
MKLLINVHFNKPVLILYFSSFLLSSCLVEQPLKTPQGYTPLDLGDGWKVGQPSDQGVNAQELRKAFELVAGRDPDFLTAKSLLVVRHGAIIGELYNRSGEINQAGNVMSVAKSITALLVGIAIENGYLSANLDTAVADYFPQIMQAYPDKKAITIKHLLTMTSGLDYDEYHSSKDLLVNKNGANSLHYLLSLPMKHPPGAVFQYKSGDTWLAGALLEKATGLSLNDFAAKYLFDPLDIQEVIWTRHPDGTTNAAFNLWLRPRDLAKIGQLVLNGGIWENKTIVSRQWITEMTKMQAQNQVDQYGYFWWILPHFNGFTANGHGGQYCATFPEQDLVVVLVSEPDVLRYSFGITQKKFDRLLTLITKAIEE